MIELPKEIAQMIKTIEDAGFEAYAVGGCVRDSILGKLPEDWDLTSNASRASLEAIFPDAAVVNRKLGVMRISEGEVTADIAAYRIDGEYRDYRRPETVIFTEDIVEDLRRRDFTMNAIAVNPARGIMDPYHGQEDIEHKLIRGIGDPSVRFEEDALRILRAVRFAAQLGFEIDEDTLQAMKGRANLLEYISVERIREEFAKTITAPNAGKGLALCLETGALPYILGMDCLKTASETELKLFLLLTKSIDRTTSQLRLRLALFYLCFEKSRALKAIDTLGYSNEMKKLLQCAVSLADDLENINDKPELKRFICGVGLDCYKYLTDVSEQRCKVYGTGSGALLLRQKMFDSVENNMEPVFIEDLAVDGNDLIALGITGVEIGKTLNSLLDTVHRNPEENKKELLLKIAAERICLTKK